MKKYILIGEAWGEIRFDDRHACDSYPGGDMVGVARELVAKGIKPMLLTELGNDRVGKEIVGQLTQAGINCEYADTMADKTSIVLRFPDQTDGATQQRCLERYDIPSPNEGFDIKWPRVDHGDIVVFSGYIALDERIRDRFWQFLQNCKDHKARLVYILGVDDSRVKRITRVMPTVFENLEIADVVVALPADLQVLYNHNDSEKAYRNNLSFYCSDVAVISMPAGATMPACSTFGSLAPIEGDSVYTALANLISNL